MLSRLRIRKSKSSDNIAKDDDDLSYRSNITASSSADQIADGLPCYSGCGILTECPFNCGTMRCIKCGVREFMGVKGHNISCVTKRLQHCDSESIIFACSHRCRTFDCDKCGKTYYVDVEAGEVREGHDVKCGEKGLRVAMLNY